MKAIIPTGGRGTRMRPVTYSTNKHFIPVANKPLILYPIETVAEAGISDIGITYNPGGLEEARALLGDGSRFGVKITYVLQEKPAGLANIIEVCEEFVSGDRFLLHLGDNIFIDGISDLVNFFQEKKPNALVTMVHHKDNQRLGVPFFDDNGKFIKYVEKPDNPPNDFGIPGLYFFDSNVFQAFKGEGRIEASDRGEYEIGSLYNWLIDHGFQVEAMEYNGKWLDPGRFDDWLEANRYILDMKLKEMNEGEVDEKSEILGKVSIGKGTKIVNSKVMGPSVLGDNVQIINSQVGPHLSVSDGCRVENSQVSDSVLMEGVIVSNLSKKLEASLIGSDSEIVNTDGSNKVVKMFLGEKSKVEI